LNKCKFFQKKIIYLGHVISCEGLRKDDSKVRATLLAPRLQDVHEVKGVCGYDKLLLQILKQFIWFNGAYLSFIKERANI